MANPGWPILTNRYRYYLSGNTIMCSLTPKVYAYAPYVICMKTDWDMSENSIPI